MPTETATRIKDDTCIECVPDWRDRDPFDSHGICATHRLEMITQLGDRMNAAGGVPLHPQSPVARAAFGDAAKGPQRCAKGFADCETDHAAEVRCSECGGPAKHVPGAGNLREGWECYGCSWTRGFEWVAS